MRLQDARIVLTGAAGGIGAPLAQALCARGARLALVGRNASALGDLQQQLPAGRSEVIVADLLAAEAPQMVVERALSVLGHVDVLINLAGMSGFRPFVRETAQETEQLLRLNVLAPMQLCRLLLPHMLARGSGRIVNVGSVFGSIGFAWFASYSASKAAVRVFSEALRRELAGSGVQVTHIAPRAVKTAFNSGALYRMAAQVKMNIDAPQWVAQQIVAALERDQKERFPGFPENLFVRINALFPRLVDAALKKQNEAARPHAQDNQSG